MTTLVRKNQGWLPSVFNDLFEHPLFAQRMPVVEEQIKVINHRIGDLEQYHK